MNEIAIFTTLFEAFIGRDLDNADFFRTDIFPMVGLVMTIISILLPVTYYYAINSPSFNKKIHWFLIASLGALIIFGFALSQAYSHLITINQVTDTMYPYFWFFALTASFWTIVLTFLVSLLIKNWSSQCKYVPIRFPL